MKKAMFIVAGLALLGSAAMWRFEVAPRLTERIPPGWKWESRFVGIQTLADPQTGKWPDKDNTCFFEMFTRIASEADRPRSVLLEDSYIVRNPKTGQKAWEYTFSAPVDPKTGAHIQEEYRGDIYLFPRNVEKKTYSFRTTYMKGVPLSFQKEEEVEGNLTYLFTYKGSGEYTVTFSGTESYPSVKLEPGQEIMCADDQFILKVWVEPVTGEIAKTEQGCYSGDYVYDIATGRKLYAFDRWGGISAGDDVVRRAEFIRAERTKLLWVGQYTPPLLVLAGVICFVFGTIPEISNFPWLPARYRRSEDV